MNPYDDNEDQEIEELAEKFRLAVDSGDPLFFDSMDLQDIIAYYLENNDLEFCKKALTYAMETYPQEPYFRLLHSKYLAIQMKFSEAEHELDFVEEHFEPMPELYIERVLLAHACHKEINGLELLQKSLELDEAIPETHLLITIEYVNRHKIADAVAHATRAIQLDAAIAEDLKILIMDFGNAFQKENNQTIEFFTAMSEEMPLCSHMWCGLGLAHLNVSNFDQAIEAFQFQTSVDPDDPFAFVNLGESYFGKEDYAAAAENFKIANSKCDYFQFNIQIGRCYAMLKQYDDALQYFIKANDMDPFFLMKYTEIVKVFRDLGQLDDARTYLRMHIQDCPNETRAIEELLNLLNPETDAAEITLLLRKIELNTEDPYDFLSFSTYFCYNNDCPDLGLKICQEHLDDEEVCENIGYFLSALYFKKGLHPQGCEHLENALLICKENFVTDFIRIDYQLKDIPEVANLLDQYGCNGDHPYKEDYKDFPFNL
ncbi:MAG: tetratricopeptide repeat protein [Bacteroidales bacterium]|nr:tetratricopeptide repeat protein [Bacteroidales bacterium]